MHSRFWLLSLATLFALSACTEELGAPSEALRLLSQRLDNAFLGEAYSADIRAIGGVSPYSFTLERGDLPPGLSLQGGTIRGTPTELGRFTFTIAVSDTNLSQTFEEYALAVTEAPPASLVLNVPNTEIREATRFRVEVEDARELQALRALLSWDAQRFALVEESVRASRNNLALLSRAEEPGRLNVDMAVLGAPLTGNQFVFEFSLVPTGEPSTVEVSAQTEFRSSDGAHAYSETRAGRRPPPLAEENVRDETSEDAPGSDEDGGESDDNSNDPDNDPGDDTGNDDSQEGSSP